MPANGQPWVTMIGGAGADQGPQRRAQGSRWSISLSCSSVRRSVAPRRTDYSAVKVDVSGGGGATSSRTAAQARREYLIARRQLGARSRRGLLEARGVRKRVSVREDGAQDGRGQVADQGRQPGPRRRLYAALDVLVEQLRRSPAVACAGKAERATQFVTGAGRPSPALTESGQEADPKRPWCGCLSRQDEPAASDRGGLLCLGR